LLKTCKERLPQIRLCSQPQGLRPVWRCKFVHTADRKHGLAVSPNVLSRQFEQALPNQVWVADITYIRTRSGWLYLAALLDVHSRQIVG
jgi:putative transposase